MKSGKHSESRKIGIDRNTESKDIRYGCGNCLTTNIVPNSLSSVTKEIESKQCSGNELDSGKRRQNRKTGGEAKSEQLNRNITVHPISTIVTYGNILANCLISTVTQSNNGD